MYMHIYGGLSARSLTEDFEYGVATIKETAQSWSAQWGSGGDCWDSSFLCEHCIPSSSVWPAVCMCILHLPARVPGITCPVSPVLGPGAITCLPSIRIAGFGDSLKLHPLMKLYTIYGSSGM